MLTTLHAFGEVLLPLVIVISVGFVLGHAFPLDTRTLNRISIYGLSPCLVFVSLLRTEIARDAALRLALLMLLVVVGISGCAYLLALTLRLERQERSGFLIASSFMNSGNYGLPATRFAFGEAGFQYALIGYLTQAILSQTYAVYLASAGNGNWHAALVQVLRMPLVHATLVAIGLRLLGIRLDETNGPLAFGIFRGLRLLADAALPLLLLILGMQLTKRQPLSAWPSLGAAVALRLLGAIPLAYGGALLLGLDGLPLRVGIIQAAMPTAVNMTIVALEFNAWPQFVSNVVILTTLGSLVTLTLLLVALR